MNALKKTLFQESVVVNANLQTQIIQLKSTGATSTQKWQTKGCITFEIYNNGTGNIIVSTTGDGTTGRVIVPGGGYSPPGDFRLKRWQAFTIYFVDAAGVAEISADFVTLGNYNSIERDFFS